MNKKGEFDIANLIAILLALIMTFDIVMSLIGHHIQEETCLNANGKISTQNNCIIGDTSYKMENINYWGFIPEYKLTKQAVEDK